MSSKERYCYFGDPLGSRTLLRSMGLAFEVARPESTILLAVHAKGALLDNELVTGAFGRKALENLWKRKRLASKLPGYDVQLMTSRIAPRGWDGDTVLVFFPNQRLLDRVEKLEGVARLIVVPEQLPDPDIQAWFDEFAPRMIKAPR
jgi:hypothetical protein